MTKVKDLFAQIIKFASVGLICFGIDYFGLIILTEWTSLTYFMSSAISYTVSVVINYWLSMRFVFEGRDDRSKFTELVIFAVLSIIGLMLTQLMMWIAVEFLGLFYALAKILASMIVTTYNFISKKIFLEEVPED